MSERVYLSQDPAVLDDEFGVVRNDRCFPWLRRWFQNDSTPESGLTDWKVEEILD